MGGGGWGGSKVEVAASTLLAIASTRQCCGLKLEIEPAPCLSRGEAPKLSGGNGRRSTVLKSFMSFCSFCKFVLYSQKNRYDFCTVRLEWKLEANFEN
jgi:hypothetical protein